MASKPSTWFRGNYLNLIVELIFQFHLLYVLSIIATSSNAYGTDNNIMNRTFGDLTRDCKLFLLFSFFSFFKFGIVGIYYF
jgi:hypothetical protein